MTEAVFTVRARTESQGALEDIILAALEHAEGGVFRYERVEVPEAYVREDLQTKDDHEIEAWAERFRVESGVEASFAGGAWQFKRGPGFNDGQGTGASP